ncbi:hypothetical protein IAR50_003286 [Cryptococcus sp. DSM 104548]
MGEQPAKRLRTKRACDYCRQHRIRCEFGLDQDVCNHCKRYQIQCKKETRPPPDRRQRTIAKDADPHGELESFQGIEPGYLGPSSVTQQIHDHCYATSSTEHKIQRLESRLDIYPDAFEENHDRGRLVGRPPDIGETARRRAVAAATAIRVQEGLIEKLGTESILNDLMSSCQRSFLPLFPAVSVHESLGRRIPTPEFEAIFGNFHINSTPPTSLPQVFRLLICAIPAASRGVPVHIRESIFSALNSSLDSMDFSMGMASLSNVQIHLLMSVNDGLWKRGPMGRAVYAATRMATGLALHRGVSRQAIPIAQINRRARIWGACIIADRWMTLRLGQMPSIDLSYADAPFPSHLPDHILDGTNYPPDTIPCFRFHQEMTKLADLLGRAYRLSCSPFGLKQSEEYSHFLWQIDYLQWRAQIPHSWPYSANLDTPQATPILNLLTVAVLYTFIQPFYWPTQPIPENVTYRPPDVFWDNIVAMAGESVEWMCGAGTFYLDIWSTLLHPFICCLLVEAKAAQKGSFTASLLLDRGIQVISDWAKYGESPQYVTYQRADIVEMVQALKDEGGIEAAQALLTL